jgi:hypothetical protein
LGPRTAVHALRVQPNDAEIRPEIEEFRQLQILEVH